MEVKTKLKKAKECIRIITGMVLWTMIGACIQKSLGIEYEALEIEYIQDNQQKYKWIVWIIFFAVMGTIKVLIYWDRKKGKKIDFKS